MDQKSEQAEADGKSGGKLLNFGQLWPYADLLLIGVANTLLIMLICGVLGLAMAIVLAELRRSGPKWLRWLISAYVEVIRDTPFLVQLFFIYFGLPGLGLRIEAWNAAAIALTLNAGAYFTEIIRAGLEATPSGQLEAARALGLTKFQSFIKVVLPPAMGRVYTPLVSQFVLLFLGSAVISQISVEELTYQAHFIESRTFRSFEVYIVVTILYIATSYACRLGLLRLSPWLFPWSSVRR